MFDIGLQELVIIFVVALLVFGPKRLPEVGRTMGKWIGELRKTIYDAKMQMESEFEDVQKETQEKPAKEEISGGQTPLDKQDVASEEEGSPRKDKEDK